MPDVNLYFIAVIPDDQTSQEVMRFKQIVADQFSSKGALRSPPHITLHMPFKWIKDRESLLLETLERFQFDEYPFQTRLKDFSYFEPRVIFVDVPDHAVLRKLYHNLSQFIRRELKILNADYKARGFHPHMTIGFRDLKKPKFYEAKSYFDQKQYEAEFKVNGFWLLKYEEQKWNPFRFFGL